MYVFHFSLLPLISLLTLEVKYHVRPVGSTSCCRVRAGAGGFRDVPELRLGSKEYSQHWPKLVMDEAWRHFLKRTFYELLSSPEIDIQMLSYQI